MSQTTTDWHGINLEAIADDKGGHLSSCDDPDAVNKFIDYGDLVFKAVADDGSYVKAFELLQYGFAFVMWGSSQGPETYHVYARPEEAIQHGIGEHESDAGITYRVKQNDVNYYVGK